MPINRLLKEAEFKPAEVERLNRAFSLALSSLGLLDRNDPLCELVAYTIIEVHSARLNAHDPKQIAILAVEKLRMLPAGRLRTSVRHHLWELRRRNFI